MKASKFTFLILLTVSLNSFAQTKTFEDYYFEFKALTDSLKTYNVVVKFGDTSFTFFNPALKASIDYSFPKHKNIISEVFHFLNTKNIDSLNPDFIIYFFADHKKVEKPTYTLTPGSDDNSDVYDVKISYTIDFYLEMQTREGKHILMEVCRNKNFEHFYRMPIAKPGVDTRRNENVPKAPKNIVEYLDELYSVYNNKHFNLIDYLETLRKYQRKGKG